MDSKEKNKVDQLQMRCPRLGGEVTFGYCRVEGGDIPCPRTITCWQPYLPVEEYLKQTLTPQQWDRWSAGKPKEKMASLLDLIDEARKRLQEEP